MPLPQEAKLVTRCATISVDSEVEAASSPRLGLDERGSDGKQKGARFFRSTTPSPLDGQSGTHQEEERVELLCTAPSPLAI
jgi:hypothetical protein